MSSPSPSPSQLNANQNPPINAIVELSKNDTASPLTETESVASLNPPVEVETEASTVDPSLGIRRTSPESFILKGGTLKRNTNGTKNEVWQFFKVYNENKFKTRVFCVLCKSDVSYGKTHSTSNLEKHMQRHHKKEYASIMKERAEKRLKIHAEISGSTSLPKQQKISSYMETVDNYQECLVKWMIDSYQPLSAVEKDSFRAMINCLNSKAPVIGFDKIRTLMSNKYFDAMHDVSTILKGKAVALTTDAWTSIAKEGYVTCTIHFIEPKTWTLHHFSLGIFKKDGNSTAVDVVRYAEGHMQNFNVTYHQLTCVVTDTESTMIAAGRIFKEKSSEAGGSTAWHGCIDHKLELVTKLAFKDVPESIGTMATCRAIVAFFNSSSQATEKLKEKTKARLGVALTVIQDVVTRWWSTYSMCERLLRLRNILTIMHLDGDMRLHLTEAHWVVVKDMVALLKPFMVAQRLLEGQSYVTISLIPYMLYKIRSGLMAANADPTSSLQVRSVSTLMLVKFNEEFGTGEQNTVATDYLAEGSRRRVKGLPKIVMIAMCLDPRTKSAIGIPLADREVIWEYVFDDLVDLVLQIGPPIAPAPVPLVPAQEQPLVQGRNRNNHLGFGYAHDVDDFLHELDENVNDEDDLQELIDANDDPENLIGDAAENWNRETVGEIIRAEIDLYKSAKGLKLTDPETGNYSNPLHWWRVHQSDFPYLAKLSVRYLAIPATSAPSERVFSTAGLTISKERARLESSRANELVFLHDSGPALEKYHTIVNRES
jgi:hypothetical protein